MYIHCDTHVHVHTHICTHTYTLEMGQYIDILLYHDTLRQQYGIDTNSSHIDISNIMIYQHIGINRFNTAHIYAVLIG